MTSSETRLPSGESTIGFEMVSDLFVNLTFEDLRKAGWIDIGTSLGLECLPL